MDITTREIFRLLTSKGKYCDTFFVFDGKQFAENISRFTKAFENKFDKFELAYSTKTNPHPIVLHAVKKSGSSIEIVSPYEYRLVKSIGFDDKDIIYNGVIPDYHYKYAVALNGGKVNIENANEFKRIAIMAKSADVKLKVGIRLNVDLFGNCRRVSRFGITPESEEFKECVNLQNEHCRIAGVHLHVHGGRGLEMWDKRAETVGRIAKELDVEYIDFGSNLFGFMDDRLADQFDEEIPSPEMYADVIHSRLSEIFLSIPKVIIEPGTPVVANAVSLVGKVENIFKRYDRHYATASCSIYDCGFFHGSDKKVPMDVIHVSSGEQVDKLKIYGYACTEDDILCDSYTGRIAIGDWLVFNNLGAYAYSLSSDFIKKKPDFFQINE